MRKIKKMTSLAIAGLMGASLLAGCGSSSTTSSTATTASSSKAATTASSTASTSEAAVEATSTTETAEAGYSMAYVLSVRDEYLSLLEEAVNTAALANNVDIDCYFAENDSSRTIQYIEQAVNEGKDAILVNMVVSQDAPACIEAAGDTKMVFVNRSPEDTSVLNENVVLVASDENLSGAAQGQFLAEYYNAQGQTDINYVLLQGTEGLVHTTLRTEKAISEMENGGLNATQVGIVQGDYDRSTAQSGMAEFLESGTDFDAVISNNDAMALGAIQAMKDAGIDPTTKVVVGIDGLGDAKAALVSGEMKMTVEQSAAGQANASIKAAINMLEGKDLVAGTSNTVAEDNPYIIYVPFNPITE